MKRLIIVAATLLCGLFVESRLSAQDIILTTDNELISAVISEIGDESIVYKKADNPDGPNFRINTSRVVKIQFANGTTQEFNNKQPEQVLFQPYAQPNNQYHAPQSQYGALSQQQYATPAPQQQVQEEPVDWKHEPLAFYYWRIGMQVGCASIPSLNTTFPSKISYDILDDIRIIMPSSFTLSALIGVSGRSSKFDDGTNYFDTHGLLFGVRPGYTVRFFPTLRLSVMAGPYISGDLWGKVQNVDGDYVSVWNIKDWNHFDTGIAVGASLGLASILEIYFEYRRGFISYIKKSDFPGYSNVFAFGVGFDF